MTSYTPFLHAITYLNYILIAGLKFLITNLVPLTKRTHIKRNLVRSKMQCVQDKGVSVVPLLTYSHFFLLVS